MSELEQLLGLFVAAVILASGARRVGAPYPVFLALGGALLAFVPAAPSFTLPPELALALFVAPCCSTRRTTRRSETSRTIGGRSPVSSSLRSGSQPSPWPSSPARSSRRCRGP